MVVVAVLSLNIAAIPWLMYTFQRFTLASIAVPEMAAILVALLHGMALRIAWTGEIDGLPIGFEAFGWAAMMAYLACLLFAPSSVSDYGDSMILPLWHALGPAHTIDIDPSSGRASVIILVDDRMGTMLWGLTHVCAYTLPQLAFAAPGGWLFRWLRVRLVVGGQDSSVESPVEIDPLAAT